MGMASSGDKITSVSALYLLNNVADMVMPAKIFINGNTYFLCLTLFSLGFPMNNEGSPYLSF